MGPVVTVAAGGIPVVDATAAKTGVPVIESAKFGVAVTKVTQGGMPVSYVGGGGGGGGQDYLNGAGAFNSATGWTLQGNSTISGGIFTAGNAAPPRCYRTADVTLVAGTYRVTVDYLPSVALGTNVTIQVGNSTVTVIVPSGSSPGNFTVDLTVPATLQLVTFSAVSTSNTGAQFDNLIVKKIG